ncbi:MAG: nitroreductase family protein [Ilumatobacteraceae bacterium]
MAPGRTGGAETDHFWRHTLAARTPGRIPLAATLDAPVIALPCTEPDAYLARYSEPDKQRSGLGESPDAWPVPYWTIDASMAVMTLLLAAEDAGLGALFFGVFRGERALRDELGIPDEVVMLGAIALGRPLAGDAAGRSAGRTRRPAADIIRRGAWG